MEEKQDEGISFGDIFKVIKRQILIVLLITLLGTVAGSLVFALYFNPRSVEYEMDFNLLYPSSENARYPDGSPFYDFDIVSMKFLEEAKGSDEAFAKLDLERMVRNNGIRLAKQQMETGSDIYTITVKGSYFSNRDTAEKFIRAAAQVPVNRIMQNAQSVDYKLNEKIFEGVSFQDKLELLSSLKSTLLEALDEWIGVFGATYRVNGVSLGNYRSAVYVVYGDSTKAILESEFEINGYDGLDIGSYTIVQAIEARKTALKAERSRNDQILEALKNQVNGNADAEMIAYYTKRNAQIDYQIETSLKEENVKAFEERLNAQFEELQQAAETVSTVTSSVYAQDHNTAVSFHRQKVRQSGGTSLVLVIGASFVLSFVFSLVIAFLADSGKKRKTEAKIG